jgi:hypothetical protein
MTLPSSSKQEYDIKKVIIFSIYLIFKKKIAALPLYRRLPIILLPVNTHKQIKP